MNSVIHSTRGVSLIELLIGIGVTTFALLNIGAYLRDVHNAVHAHERLVEVQQLITQTEYALMSGTTCTMNFANMPLTQNGPTYPLTDDLLKYEGNIAKGRLLGLNADYRHVSVIGMSLIPKRQLGTDLLSADLQIFMENKNNVGTRRFKRTIGLNFKMHLGLVQSCALTHAQTSYTEKTCDMISNQMSTYDPNTGTCTDKYEHLEEIGNKDEAQCPAGTFLDPSVGSPCEIIPPAEFDWFVFHNCVTSTTEQEHTHNGYTFSCYNTTTVPNGPNDPDPNGVHEQPGYAQVVRAEYVAEDGAISGSPLFAPPFGVARQGSPANRCTAYYNTELYKYVADTGGSWDQKFRVKAHCAKLRIVIADNGD